MLFQFIKAVCSCIDGIRQSIRTIRDPMLDGFGVRFCALTNSSLLDKVVQRDP